MISSVCWSSRIVRAPTEPMQVLIAPTSLSVPSSVSAGPQGRAPGARRAQAHANQGRVGTAVHQPEARLIGDDVPDGERDRELLLQRAEVYRGVLGGDVTGGRDGGLDDEYIGARLLGDLGEALGALGDRRDDGGPPALLDRADPLVDQLFLDG